MIETERKFLVKDLSFIKSSYKVNKISQGYLSTDPERTVRIRISNNEGFLTIKSAPDEKGWSRYEFEYKINLNDAIVLMQMCLPSIIDKERYYVNVGEHRWEVDVFHGDNEGLIMAEIELTSTEEIFEIPSWVGEEVSGDSRYYNSMLSKHPYKQWNN